MCSLLCVVMLCVGFLIIILKFYIIIVRWADLSDFLLIFVGKCVFHVSRRISFIVHFSFGKTITPQNGSVDFPLERDFHFRNNIMEIRSRILTKRVTFNNCKFLEIVEEFCV